MGDPIQISVALVTRNRPDSLRRCLESWRAQHTAPFEIVVSDDSDEPLAVVNRELAAQYGCRYLSGPRRGLYANRNRASLACVGSHILSADDDHTHPVDFVKVVLELVRRDPETIWAFGEVDPRDPGQRLSLPTELHRSGSGCAPRDCRDCAAISDGATVYPRAVFDSGLRYDESYSFGGLWYLWGKVLRKAGWRISVCDRAHVRHHSDISDRAGDREFLARQLCANTYATFVNALWLQRSGRLLAWSAYYLLRRMLYGDSIVGYAVTARISLRHAAELLRKVFAARAVYRRLPSAQPVAPLHHSFDPDLTYCAAAPARH